MWDISCLGGRNVRNNARCIPEIKSSITITKAAFDTQTTLFTCKLNLNVQKKLIKCCICSIACVALKLGHFEE